PASWPTARCCRPSSTCREATTCRPGRPLCRGTRRARLPSASSLATTARVCRAGSSPRRNRGSATPAWTAPPRCCPGAHRPVCCRRNTHSQTEAGLLKPGALCLVVDVGGGTSDFSLIQAVEQQGELGFVRQAVGDHLLLGGDNMDLALAKFVETRLPAAGKLD